jgi:signal transduction histidine kinase
LNPQNGNDLFKAYNYFNVRYEEAIKNNDKDKALRCLYYLSSADFKNGDYNAAEKTAVEALKIIDDSKNLIDLSYMQISFYNILGNIYNKKGNKEKTLKLYDTVLALSKTAKDSVIIYNNISISHKRYNEISKAEDQLLKSLTMFPRVENDITKALVLDNLGVIYTLQNNKEGLTLMQQALEIRERANDTTSIYTSYSHLAEYFNSIRDTSTAKKYALKANELANNLSAPSYRRNALGLLTDLSDDEFAKAYKRLNDSLYKAEKESLSKFALMKYDLSKSELQSEKANAKSQRLLLLAILIVLLSCGAYFLHRSKHKQDKLLQVFNTEYRISKQIHDEVATAVFQLMTKLEHEEQIQTEVISELHGLYYRARDISKEHGALDNNYPFIDHMTELIESFHGSQTNIVVKGLSNIYWSAFSEIERTTIYKVIQELLINMKKHSQASIVVLVFQKEKRKLDISYSDNGIGSDLKQGSGLKNTENRIQAINGTITFETNPTKGFKVKISI